MSQSDPFYLILREAFLGPVVELGRPWALVGGHFLGVLEHATISKVGGETARPPAP
jgi:hypothetical protein